MQHYWLKQKIHHKECGVLGNIIDVFFSATGKIRFHLYCYACPGTFEWETSFEQVVIDCNDEDRKEARKEGIGFDLASWEPTNGKGEA